MTRPPVTLQLGFGATWRTEPGSITWGPDISNRIMDRRQPVVIQRGSTSLNADMRAGTCDLTLRNNNRHYDKQHTTGPHFTTLKPGVPVRLLANPNGVDLPVFRGTIPSWPQRYDRGNRYAQAPIRAHDAFDKLSRAKIPQAAYPREVLADSPAAFWRLDERDGTVMVDSSGNGLHGDYDNATIAQDPLIVDGNGRSVQLDHVGDNRGQYKGGSLPVAAPVTIEAWVRFDRDLGQIHTILVCQRDSSFGSGLWLCVEESGFGSPNGELVINFQGLGGFYKARGSTRIDDGEIHHVVMTMATTAAADIKLYVDGSLETKTVISGATGGTWGGHHIWAVGNIAASTTSDYGIGGLIDEVAIYPTALSAARVLAHYEAGSDALAGQRSDERATYILDSLDWPAGLRDLETCRSILGAATFQAGDNALGYLSQIVETEDSLHFITPDGKYRLLDRYWRYLATEATVSQVTFSDTGSGVGVAQFESEFDDELVINVARLTRRGGTEQVATDDASVDDYGELDYSKSDLLHATDEQTLSQAQWMVATRSEPTTRIPSVRILLHKLTPTRQAAILALDLGYRVTCIRTPQKVGTAFTIDCVVAGIRHTITAAEWIVELYLEPAPDNTVDLFTLGVSQLGGTHILAY